MARLALICMSAVVLAGCGDQIGQQVQQGAQQEAYDRCLQEAERAGDGPAGDIARQGCEALAPQGE